MKQVLIYLVCLSSSLLFAQEKEVKKEKDKVIITANKEYAEKKYTEAEANYRISKSKDVSGAKSAYNLGNAIYRQEFSGEAKRAYVEAIKKATTKPEKHKAFHNLGNALMKEKDYGQAVEAYKNALRNNPSDEETRYNYALAKELLEKNPQDPDKGKGDKDKEKDKKDQPKDKEGQNKQDQKGEGDKEQDQKDKGQGKPEKQDPNQKEPNKSQPAGISKERVENLLEAVGNEEKKIQEKVNKEKIKGRPVPTEKDW
jgi:tetratricopeptide (TPR) repeat protein